MKIVPLAWGKHRVEMLKIYYSGLLLKRDFSVWGQSLLPCECCVLRCPLESCECLLLVVSFAMEE